MISVKQPQYLVSNYRTLTSVANNDGDIWLRNLMADVRVRFFVRKIKHFLEINHTMQTQSTARFTEKISDHFKEIEPSLQPHLPATSQKVPLEY